MRISKTLTALAGITSAASFLPTASALRKETRSKTKPDLKVFPKEIGAGSEILVPYLSRRSLSKRDPAPEQWPISTGDVVVEDLELPMVGETVDIVFGSESSQASENPFLTTVELVPPPNRAILVLEGYLLQSVLKEVRCEEEEEGSSLNQVILTMTQAGSVSDAFNQWLVAIVENKQQDLVVITSDIMQGCGVKERKPFLVNTMSTNGLMTTLDVKPLEWSSVAKKLSFDFGHSSKNPNLSKRTNMDKFVKVDGDDDPEDGYHGNGTLELKDDIGSRIKLFPLPAEIAAIIQPGNLPETAFQSLFGADEEEQGGEKEIPPLEVHCVGCGLSGILRYQGRFDVDSNFPNLFGTDDDDNEGGEDDGEDSDLVHLDHAWMSIEVVKDMVASMFLEVATGPKPFSFVFQQSIFPAIGNTQGLPITGFGVPGILAVTVYFDFSVKFAIEVNAPSTNVTMGGELRIPAGATVLWDLVDETEDAVKNWDTTAKLVPTTVNNITIEKDKDLSVAVNISSIPSLTFDVNALTFVSAGLRISLEMPELYTTTSLVTDVTEFCAPIGKDDYIYYPYAILFESGLATAIEAEVYAEVGLEFGGGEGTNHPDQKNPQDPLVIGAGVSEIWELWNHNLVTFPPACFVFGNIETWQGQFRNASSPEVKDQEMVVDVEKIESEFKSSGKLPDANGIDWKKLLEEKGDVLPKELKEKVVEKVEGNEKKKEDTAFVGQDDINEAIAKLEDGRTLSAWTLAVIAIGAGMFPELNLN